MKLSIIMPVYNEAPTIEAILEQVRQVSLPAGVAKEVIVVDNGSTDGSYELARAWMSARPSESSETSFLCFRHLEQGKGCAVRAGFGVATGDIVLIQDGDLEYDVNDYPSLIQPILDGKTRFVLGSRHMSCNSWKIRRFERNPVKSFLINLGGVFFHGLFNLMYGVHLSDPTTMFKVFRRECLNGLSFEATRFDFDYELLGKLIRAGNTPLEVPVAYRSRGFDEGKKIRVFVDPWTWVWAIVKYRISPLYEAESKERVTGFATGLSSLSPHETSR